MKSMPPSMPLSSQYECDAGLLAAVLDLLPSAEVHRDARWIFGRPVKRKRSWSIAVYELAPQARTTIRGEITATMTSAGVTLNYADRGNGSPIGLEAWCRLNEEMRSALGITAASGAAVGVGLAREHGESHAATAVAVAPSVLTLTETQSSHLHDILMHVFTRDELEKMVRVHLNESLAQITARNKLSSAVHDLIAWAVREQRVADLLNGTLQENPRNPRLKELLRSVGIQPHHA